MTAAYDVHRQSGQWSLEKQNIVNQREKRIIVSEYI